MPAATSEFQILAKERTRFLAALIDTLLLVALDPTDQADRIAEGMTLFAQGDAAKARDAFDTVLRADPGNPRAAALRDEALARLGKAGGAAKGEPR